MSFLDPYPAWPLLLVLFVGAAFLLRRKRARQGSRRRGQDTSGYQGDGTYAAYDGAPSRPSKDTHADAGGDVHGGSDGGGGDGGGGGGD
ncbi:hypothetical protein [Hyphomicrobium sp. CS1GBMeth3]|uniref:hypothetical protein n=1 Tax=Hyphomicrobium sp. CS1GBMeth3 TaxID=1892845 RepID=UPI000931126E|nr:hypothetical protein [Hyphomicrobium sp. CS1GBMeth3]